MVLSYFSVLSSDKFFSSPTIDFQPIYHKLFVSINYSTPSLLTHTYLTLSVSFCGREGSKQKMKPISPVREKANAHSSTNQSLTRRRSPRKSNMKMTLVQAKYASRGPRTRYGRTHCPRSPRNDSTSRCPSCPPTPSSKTPWKTSEKCK